MNIGTRINTPDGYGIITRIDLEDCNKSAQRYKVKLDVEKYSFVPCYWKHEVTI